ncbi:MAG TPA: hypothetical protein VHW01_24400 [Polyangiaceae bacterium]|jgi:hypothetical protein|nr:hypothetical protein [Polyangiaceae bacterium]
MRRFMTLLVAVAAATLSVGGCSSDSDGGGGSAGSANGQCKGDYAALTQSELDAKVAPKGGCAADVVAICGNNVTTAAEECGADCFMNMAADDATQDKCVSSCIGAALPLSDSCLACYVTDVGCARDNCKVICGIAPTSADCLTCRVTNGCTAAFFSCSGLPDEVTDTGAGGAGDTPAVGGAAGADTAPAAGAAGI